MVYKNQTGMNIILTAHLIGSLLFIVKWDIDNKVVLKVQHTFTNEYFNKYSNVNSST